MTINILGQPYKIIQKRYEDDKQFKKMGCGAYCSTNEKNIVLCDLFTYPLWEDETKNVISGQTKTLLRHEIVHAFLQESGLSTNSNSDNGPWARNEEIVDWFALQGPKIYEAWKEAGAL